MAFHKTMLGSFGTNLPSDRNGFVPEEGDDLDGFDFGDDFEGDSDLWEEFIARAVKATKEAQAALASWQST